MHLNEANKLQMPKKEFTAGKDVQILWKRGSNCEKKSQGVDEKDSAYNYL